MQCKFELWQWRAGLLPIMKEVVEMLFCKGLIKVLLSSKINDRSCLYAVQSKSFTLLTFTPVGR